MWKWLRENVFSKDMFIYILFGGIIFYTPSWGAFILGIIFGSEILLAFSLTYVLVWAGPFTPTVPAILSIAVALKQLVKRYKKRKE